MGGLASDSVALTLLFSCLAISFVCCEVVRWLERCFILATCQEKRKALNSLVHQEKARGSQKKIVF